MNLTDRIDEIKANSVTPEKFEEVWGRNLDEFMEELMDYAAQCIIDNRSNDDGDNSNTVETPLQPAAAPAAAAAAGVEDKKATKKIFKDDADGKYLIGSTGKRTLYFRVEKPDNMKMEVFSQAISDFIVKEIKGRGGRPAVSKQKLKKKATRTSMKPSERWVADFSTRTKRELSRQLAARLGSIVKTPQTGSHAPEPSPFRVAAETKKGVRLDLNAMQGVRLRIEQSAAGRPVAIVKVDTTGGRYLRRRK